MNLGETRLFAENHFGAIFSIESFCKKGNARLEGVYFSRGVCFTLPQRISGPWQSGRHEPSGHGIQTICKKGGKPHLPQLWFKFSVAIFLGTIFSTVTFSINIYIHLSIMGAGPCFQRSSDFPGFPGSSSQFNNSKGLSFSMGFDFWIFLVCWCKKQVSLTIKNWGKKT